MPKEFEVSGTVYEFPDNFTDDQVKGILSKKGIIKLAEPPSVASRIGSQALSTLGGGLKAPFQLAGAAVKSATTGSPRPLYDAVVAPQVEQFKKAGGQLQRAAGGDLSGIPGAVMYGAAGLLPGMGPLITSAVEQGTPKERGGEGDVPKAVGTLAGGGAIAPVYKYGGRALGKAVPAVAERLGGPELKPTSAELATALLSKPGAAVHYGTRQLGRLLKKPPVKTETPVPVASPPSTWRTATGRPPEPPPPAPPAPAPSTWRSSTGQSPTPPPPAPPGYSTTWQGTPDMPPPRGPIARTVPETPAEPTLESKLEQSVKQESIKAKHRDVYTNKVVNLLKSKGVTQELAETATPELKAEIAKQAGVDHISDRGWKMILDKLAGRSRSSDPLPPTRYNK